MMTDPEAHARALAELLTGRVMTGKDADFAAATTMFNAMIVNNPDVVAQVADADDVSAALRYAGEHGLDVSVRGGGHGVQGQATAGELVIDLSAMNGVVVDPAARTAVVQGGATWGPVDAATQAHGLAVPGGRVTHTGVAGLTLGGGQGWLSSKHGLTIDNLLSVDLVVADGRQITATAESEPELFWALRGGGGGFGVATSFTFRLHPVGPLILGGLLIHAAERAADVCAAYSDFVATASDDFGGAAVFLSAPPAPFVPPEAVGSPVVALVVAWFGDLGEGDRAIAPLRDLGAMIDIVQPLPYLALPGMLDSGNEYGMRQYWCASYVDKLTPTLLEDTVDRALNRPAPLCNVILAPMGNAVNRVAQDETAFGHREAGWLFHPLAQWDSAEDDAVNIAWAKDLNAAALPYTAGGTYLNVDGEAGTSERTRFAFGDAAFARLSAVKRQWDPDNVFRHTMPVS